MPRPQFTLKTMLWLVLLVTAFFGGMAVQRALLEKDYRVMRQYESNLNAEVDRRVQEISGSMPERIGKMGQTIDKQWKEIWQLRDQLANEGRPAPLGPATHE